MSARIRAARESYILSRYLVAAGQSVNAAYDWLAIAYDRPSLSLVPIKRRALVDLASASTELRAASRLDFDLVHERFEPAVREAVQRTTKMEDDLHRSAQLSGPWITDVMAGAASEAWDLAHGLAGAADVALDLSRQYAGPGWHRDFTWASLLEAGVEPEAVAGGMSGALVGLAVLMLPAPHRARYSEEFRAELFDTDPRRRVRHAARIVASALPLRASLQPRSRATEKPTRKE